MTTSNDLKRTGGKPKLSGAVLGMFVVLFVVAAGLATYLYIDNNQLTESSIDKDIKLVAVENEKLNLQDELAVVENNFNDKIADNEKLSADLKTQLKEVEALKWRVSDARKKLKTSEAENAHIVSRLGQLEVLKAGLEQDIAALALTNTELKFTNEKINTELVLANEYAQSLNDNLVEMSERNSALIEHLYSIAPAGFVADNFEVKTQKRNDKLTAKAKLTDEVRVRFELNNVPESYHGEEEIYLVLAKFDGQPVINVPTKTVDIASVEPMTIKAADIEKLNLNNHQQLDMSVATAKDLEAGTYNLLVYADHGFWGQHHSNYDKPNPFGYLFNVLAAQL